MRKILLVVLLVLTGSLANAQTDDPVIKMTTTENPGSWFMLNIEADGELTYVGLIPDDYEGYYKTTAYEVEIHGKVKRLECSYNNLVSLDVSGDPYLIELLCDDNDLTNLTIGDNPYLYRLYCGSNELESVDLKGLTGLEDFSCYANKLTSLDFSKNTQLTDLVCRGNAISGVLDLSASPNIKTISCYDNQLTGIKLSDNNTLQHMEMERNNITGSAMTDIMNALPEYVVDDEWDDWWGLNLQGLYITETNRDYEKNMPLVSDVQIATAKGWPVFSMNLDDYGEVPPTAFEGYENSGINNVRNATVTIEQTDHAIALSGVASGSHVILYSVDGRMVKKLAASSEGTSIDTTNLPTGTYVLKGTGFCRKISVK